MSKHTPGPWEVADHFDNEYGKVDFCEYQIRGPAGTNGLELQIATVISDRIPSHEANARLIAAAPELLIELRQAVIQMEMAAECIQEGRYDEALLHASSLMRSKRAAIAKATGE